MSENESIEDLVEWMRGFADDHEPDGWPAVKMSDITRLCAEIDRLRAALTEIARAHGFDNIGAWARRRARLALDGKEGER